MLGISRHAISLLLAAVSCSGAASDLCGSVAHEAVTPVASMATARSAHTATLLADGNVLVVGGADRRDWHGRYDTAEIYETAAGRFRPARAMNAARFKLAGAVVTLGNGRVLVAGGARGVEIYDPATGAFVAVNGEIDAARFFAVATRLGDGRVLITGGYDERTASTAGAWIYRD